MKISEVMTQINKMYIPGCIAHYSKQTPDPWLMVQEEWNETLQKNSGDWDLQEKINELFYKKQRALILDYEQTLKGPAIVNPAQDSFMLGEDRTQKFFSVRHKICYQCEGEDGLKIAMDANKNTFLICKDCLSQQRSA